MAFNMRFVCTLVTASVIGLGFSAAAEEAVVRVWTGLGGDSNASTAANWQDEISPQEGDQVKILHTANDKAITWDLSGSFGDWTIENYTNSLTANVTLSLGSLTVGTTNLTTTVSFAKPVSIAGDLTLMKGAKLTHPENASVQTVQLDVTVQGSCTIEENASINVTAKGAKNEYSHNLAHGGRTFTCNNKGVVSELSATCFGSAYYPTTVGGGYYVDIKNISHGGGAVKLSVGGTMTLNGTIEACSNLVGWNYASGSGGSVWITAASLSGTGEIWASGGPKGSRYNNSVMGVGAGGRIAVHLTDPTADFSSFAIDKLHAYGFGRQTQYAGAGTVYLKTGAQKVSEGTLIIDNETTSANTRATEIGADAGDCEFGTIIIRNGGKLSVRDGKTLKVAGDWLNAGTFTAEPGTAVQFVGSTPAVISNSNAFANFICSEPGKVLKFAPGTTTSVAAGGLFKIEGSADERVELVSAEPGQTWNLALGATSGMSVSFVNVRDSSARVGADGTIAGVNGTATDSTGWEFVNVNPGETITWTGNAGSSVWGAPGNWDRGRAPVATDKVVVGVAGMSPVLSSDLTVASLTVAADASLDLGGFALTVNGPLTVAGELKTSGAPDIVVTGAVAFSGAASVAQAAWHVRGNSLTTVATARYNTVFVESAALSVAGTLACHELIVGDGASARTITFADGAKVETDILTASGSPTDKNVVLTSVGTWQLKAMKADVSGVTVTGSDASLGLPVVPKDSVDGGRNVNWLFNDARLYWDGKAALSETDDIVITNGIAGEIKVETTIKSLSLEGGSLKVSKKLTVTESVSVCAGSTLTWNVPGQIGGNFVVLEGGTVTHTANSKADTYAIDLQIGGNAYVAEGGVIDVMGKGYNSNVCPWGSPSYGGAGGHGSWSGSYQGCYGSVLCPTNSGSMAFNGTAGGGIVGLACAGSLTVDGQILANGIDSKGGSGAGGSIRLTATSMSGSSKGKILACGGASGGNYYAGAGRIAIRLTEATSLSAFGGVIGVYGGFSGTAYSSAGTLYVETAADSEKAGTVTFANPTEAVTLKAGYSDLPATQAVGDPNELKLTKVRIGHVSKVRLTRDLVIRDLEMVDSTATLDLNGHTLTVKSFRHPLTGTVTTGTGGKIDWLTPGFQIIVR